MMNDLPSYVPKSVAGRWLESRLPILGFVHSSFVAFPNPRNLNYFWTFGGILAFTLAAQIVTGVALSMHYTPEATLAFASVEHIMRDVNYGWLLRYAHSSGASMFFFAVYVHIARGLYYGSYKAPREVLWILGVVILLLMMATAFMGYVLPWGQMSFWGAKVITSLFSAIPYVGDAITVWLWGGYSVSGATLNRFYALHYLLPFMILGMVILHIWALHVPGSNNPIGVEVKSQKDTLPFHPFFTVKDGFALVCCMIFYAYFIFYVPGYLLAPDNYIEANPLVTPAHIVPEWYFLPYYAMLRAVPSKLGGVCALFGSILLLAFLPWLDTSRIRSANFRPLYRWFLFAFFATVAGLGYCGSQEPVGAIVTWSQILTAWYFIHLLIVLPLLGFFETPFPLPASIADAVLAPSMVIPLRPSTAGPGRGDRLSPTKESREVNRWRGQ